MSLNLSHFFAALAGVMLGFLVDDLRQGEYHNVFFSVAVALCNLCTAYLFAR